MDLCEGAQFVLQQIFVALDRTLLCAEPKISKSRIFPIFMGAAFGFLIL